MNIEISDQEKEVIIKALDLYSRLLCGQFEELSLMYRHGKLVPVEKMDFKKMEKIDDHIYGLKRLLFPELPANGCHSIMSEEAPEKAKVAYAIYDRLK